MAVYSEGMTLFWKYDCSDGMTVYLECITISLFSRHDFLYSEDITVCILEEWQCILKAWMFLFRKHDCLYSECMIVSILKAWLYLFWRYDCLYSEGVPLYSEGVTVSILKAWLSIFWRHDCLYSERMTVSILTAWLYSDSVTIYIINVWLSLFYSEGITASLFWKCDCWFTLKACLSLFWKSDYIYMVSLTKSLNCVKAMYSSVQYKTIMNYFFLSKSIH